MGMLFWWCLCEDDEMETIHRWIEGVAPLLYTLAVILRIPCPSPGDQENLIIGCYLCVTAPGTEQRWKAGVRLYTVISPPPHGSGFILGSLLNPKHNMMSRLGSASQLISRVDELVSSFFLCFWNLFANRNKRKDRLVSLYFLEYIFIGFTHLNVSVLDVLIISFNIVINEKLNR